MKRRIVFGDYSNFYSTLKVLLDGDPSRVKESDYQRFVQAISNGNDLIKVYFACSKKEGERDGVAKFFDWVDYQPFFYVKSFDRIVDPQTQASPEKQVDVYLATQIVALAYENAYDIAVLISGDQDFIPAIEVIQQKGKIVIVISAEKHISGLLRKKADRTVLLDSPGEYHFDNFLKSA